MANLTGCSLNPPHSTPLERRAVVENFLASLDPSPADWRLAQHEAYENARLDARLYRWSPGVLEAVILGIGSHFSLKAP